MQSKINDLINLYKENKNKYLFNDANTIEFNEKENINISLVKSDNEYYIFIFFLEEEKIIFKGLYKKSDDNLLEEYNNLVNELNKLNYDDFIEKYYDILISQF